jgi:hypothetical protein
MEGYTCQTQTETQKNPAMFSQQLGESVLQIMPDYTSGPEYPQDLLCSD